MAPVAVEAALTYLFVGIVVPVAAAVAVAAGLTVGDSSAGFRSVIFGQGSFQRFGKGTIIRASFI